MNKLKSIKEINNQHPYAVVLCSAALFTATISFIIYFNFPFILLPDKNWAFFGAKLTFLSIMVAVG